MTIFHTELANFFSSKIWISRKTVLTLGCLAEILVYMSIFNHADYEYEKIKIFALRKNSSYSHRNSGVWKIEVFALKWAYLEQAKSLPIGFGVVG
jgi:hypothetical protein